MENRNEKVEIIQINISGEDKPGLTSSLTDILARYDATILDIGQANIHQTLSMGILFKTDSQRAGDIMKDLLFKAYELGIQVRFKPITAEQYENWVGMQGKNRYIITVLGRKLSAQQIAAVTNVVAGQGLNIDSILRLTGAYSVGCRCARSKIVHRTVGARYAARPRGDAVRIHAAFDRNGDGYFVSGR